MITKIERDAIAKNHASTTPACLLSVKGRDHAALCLPDLDAIGFVVQIEDAFLDVIVYLSRDGLECLFDMVSRLCARLNEQDTVLLCPFLSFLRGDLPRVFEISLVPD